MENNSLRRIVSTALWTDRKVVEEFTPEDKYFWLYLLTNPDTTQLGIYPLTIKTAAHRLGYTSDTVRVLLSRFENNYGVIKYSDETGEVAIKNYLRYGISKGGKPVLDLLLKEESQVKDKSLVGYVFENLEKYDSATINKTVLEFIGTVTADDDAEEPAHKEDKIPYSEIIGRLNTVCGTRFSVKTEATKKLIRGRFRDGYKLDDFFKVIDAKSAQWLHDEKMSKYLRPQTLFGNKFESYLMDAEKHDVRKTNVLFADVKTMIEEPELTDEEWLNT
jgi:uncharacterized phage protein (TIGR02220 family)